jgi:hypothetical protein
MKGKFASVMAILGLILSLICGLIVGNRILHILTISLFSSLIMGLVGFGVFSILEKKVPEFIEFLNNLSFKSGFSDDFEDQIEGVDLDENADHKSEIPTTDFEDSTAPISNSKDNSKFGDHIMVDNIPIKNEPKLMAEAIRTFLAMDDSSSAQPKQ